MHDECEECVHGTECPAASTEDGECHGEWIFKSNAKATAPPPGSPSNSSDGLVSTLREAQDFEKSAFVVTLADVRDMAEYAKHDKWRCAHYKRCHCGLDDLTDKIGLERIPCE